MLWYNPEGWGGQGGGRRVQDGGIHVHLWLIHVDVWQKPPQYLKSLSSDENIKIFKKFKNTRIKLYSRRI